LIRSKLSPPRSLDIDFIYYGIEHALVPWWDKSLNVSGAYVEV